MNFIVEGNTNATVPILLMCFSSLVLISVVIIRGIMKKSSPPFLIDMILLLGLFSFSYPIFRLIVGLFPAADAIIIAGEISTTLLWNAIRISLISITMGFISLHVSAIGWFVVRRFKAKKS